MPSASCSWATTCCPRSSTWAGPPLALLAGWCIGRPYGVAPVTICGVAALLVTPGLVATQPGGAYDDIVGLALLLSSAALLVTAAHGVPSNRLAGQAIAALAAGLAMGTKFTFVAPVGALTVGIWVLARRGRRWTETGVWLLLVIVTGGFWYLRNLIIVGSPLPSLHSSSDRSRSQSARRHADVDSQSLPPERECVAPLPVPRPPSLLRSRLVGGARPGALGLILGAATGPGRMARMLAWVGLSAAWPFSSPAVPGGPGGAGASSSTMSATAIRPCCWAWCSSRWFRSSGAVGRPGVCSPPTEGSWS